MDHISHYVPLSKTLFNLVSDIKQITTNTRTLFSKSNKPTLSTMFNPHAKHLASKDTQNKSTLSQRYLIDPVEVTSNLDKFTSDDANIRAKKKLLPVNSSLEYLNPYAIKIFSENDPTWGFLNPYHSASFYAQEDIFWKTIEHYFQAHRFVSTSSAFRQIANYDKPRNLDVFADSLEEKYQEDLVSDFMLKRKNIMQKGVVAKLVYNEEMGKRLKDEERVPIIYCDERSSYWGIGQHGQGKNEYGKIVELARTSLETLY